MKTEKQIADVLLHMYEVEAEEIVSLGSSSTNSYALKKFNKLLKDARVYFPELPEIEFETVEDYTIDRRHIMKSIKLALSYIYPDYVGICKDPSELSGTRQKYYPGADTDLLRKSNNIEPRKTSEFDVFISYSTRDSGLAIEIKDMLLNSGVRSFLAEKDVRAGDLWKNRIISSLRYAKCVVVIVSANSIQSDWILFEVGAAWGIGIPCVPATVGIDISKAPSQIQDYQGLSISTLEERKQLINQINILIASNGD